MQVKLTFFFYSESSDMMYRTFSQCTADRSCYSGFAPLSRHTTVASIISQQLLTENDQQGHQKQYVKPSKSNFVQSVFNAVNVLVGVGILALPLSLKLAGWLFGSLIFLFCCLATNYTAKVIVKCLSRSDGGTYGDMGEIAFGDKGRRVISSVFVVELITIGYVNKKKGTYLHTYMYILTSCI
jgi:vesicular inhibitory amino acid transporter